MKRSRLSYDEWKCILSKRMYGKEINSDEFCGYIGLIEIEEVTKPQIWKFNRTDIVICDKGLSWLSILPKDEFYCITAMLNEQNEILLWYIDMIAKQGIDDDKVPYFDDLYLDLVVYPDGTIIVDDMNELEDALRAKDISQEQFNLAIKTAEQLKTKILHSISDFTKDTIKCYQLLQ